MIEWLKAHKFYVIIGTIGVFVLSYYYLSNSSKIEETQTVEEWLPADEYEMSSELNQPDVPKNEEQPMVILADIKGAVANPGVYEVFENERIINLIEKAGGLTEEADESAVNFALRVTDEMAVFIPQKGEELPGAPGVISLGGEEGPNKEGKVNLNTATASELETLPGIGPSKSTAIIEFRESEGPFKTIEDVKQISGIGEKTFEKLKDAITVK